MNLLLANIGKPYIPGWGDLGPFVAECWLIVTIVAVLLTPFFARRSNLATAMVSLAGITVALVSLLYYGVTADAGAAQPLRGILVSDHVALLWKAMLLFFTGGVVLMWLSTTSRTFHEGDGPEFFTLLLGATLGMCLMGSTTNLLMIFMVVEMASLPSYVLAGFRKTHRLGAEASLKYVLFGAATSAIMAYGLSFLYGLYGTLDVAEIAQRISTGGAGSPALLTVALFGFIVGIGFKVSAVPFHFWCPDVFEGASIEVSAFLSVASKGAAVVLLLRVLMTIADVFGYQHAQPLTALAVTIGVIGAVTATVGNTAAFVQNNIKRLLAYSSIAHAGYMLCAISLLYNVHSKQTDGGVNAPTQAILFYLAVYLFMNLGAFTVAAIVSRATGSEDLSAFRGLVKRSPLLAHCMLCFMFSLVGLPPFAGFVAKVNVLLVLINNGGWWWVLVAVIGVNTIASLYYYARVIKVMYLDSPATPAEPAFVGHPLAVALSVVCAATLLLMFLRTGRLNDITRNYSRIHNVTGAPRPAASTQPATTRPTATASARTP